MNFNNENIDHDLLMIFLLGEADEKQTSTVNEWLQSSDENQKYLDDLEKIWIESGKLDPVPINVDIDAAWDKVCEKIDFEENRDVIDLRPKDDVKRYNRLMRIAAILLLVAGSLFIIKFFVQKPEELTINSELATINDTLPDGSLIALNINSKIVFPEVFDDEIREVDLEGEAFFDVEHNKEQAFVIHADKANIKVLGTSFNVKAYPGNREVEVIVENGTVMLFGILENGDTSSVILTAGERGILDNISKKASKIEEQIEDEVFWNKRKLIFEETELSKVFEILKKAYNINIFVNNDAINNCIYTATFYDNSIDDILQVIKESYNLSIAKEDKTYTIDGEGC